MYSGLSQLPPSPSLPSRPAGGLGAVQRCPHPVPTRGRQALCLCSAPTAPPALLALHLQSPWLHGPSAATPGSSHPLHAIAPRPLRCSAPCRRLCVCQRVAPWPCCAHRDGRWDHSSVGGRGGGGHGAHTQPQRRSVGQHLALHCTSPLPAAGRCASRAAVSVRLSEQEMISCTNDPPGPGAAQGSTAHPPVPTHSCCSLPPLFFLPPGFPSAAEHVEPWSGAGSAAPIGHTAALPPAALSGQKHGVVRG